MKKEKLRKILAIRDYNLKKEDEFPKNPNNITKDELHDHFDLDDDGKVTLDEYADHINFHCDNPEILDDELQQADFERGFKYAKGGIVWKKNIGYNDWGYISESGKSKVYREGQYVSNEGLGKVVNEWEADENSVFDKTKGKWIVEVEGINKGAFNNLKIAKRIAEQWENKIPKEYAKGGKTKKAKTWKEKYNKKYGNELDASNSLSDIAEDTGVSKKGIQQIYNKGIGAYKTNPSSVRPNVKSKEQWAQARVYSAVMGGKASKVDKKELSMEKGGIMDSRRNKDIEFDRAQEREYMRSQYDRLTQDDKEKLKMIQQMMAKEKVNYAKGGNLMSSGIETRELADSFTFEELNKLLKDKKISKADYNGAKGYLQSWINMHPTYLPQRDLNSPKRQEIRDRYAKGGELDDNVLYVLIVRKLDKVRNKLTDIKLKADLYTEKGVEEFRKKTKPLKEEERKLEDKLEEIGGEKYILPFAKGGKLRNTEYNLRTFFTFDGEDFAIFGGHLYGAREGDNEFMLIDNINYAPKEVQVAYYEKMRGFAKGGEVKKSEKYGSEYKKEDSQLLFRPINTKEDWSEVSDEAFNKEERKDFDKEMNRIFKKGGKTDTKISNLVTVGAIEKPLKDLEKIGKLKLEYLYNQLKISKNLLDNSIGKDDRIMNSVRYDSIQKLIDNILIK